MGVSGSFLVIYGPVWVNNHAPEESSTTWMGILQSTAAIGVMIGYLCAGLLVNFFSNGLSWRFAIQIQGVAVIPLGIYFMNENRKFIEVNQSEDEKLETEINKSNSAKPSSRTQSKIKRGSRKTKTLRVNTIELDTIKTDDLTKYLVEAKEVLLNSLYISVTLALCSMYFIVTSIQFWLTAYLIDILNYQPITVLILFSVCSITAPLFGVIMGGTFADKYGGYKGKNVLKALKLCFAFGLLDFVFAFPLGFLYSLIYIFVLLWTFLFFGAAIIPVGTGIMISCVRK